MSVIIGHGHGRACLLLCVPLKQIVIVLVYAPPFILCVSKSYRWLSLLFTNYIACALPKLLGLDF